METKSPKQLELPYWQMVATILLTPAIWFVFGLAKLALGIIGLIAVPLSMVGDGRKRTPKMFWLWGNDEKGFRNEDFDNIHQLLMDRLFRNPSGNTKYLLADWFGDPEVFAQYGVKRHIEGEETDPLELGNGFQWRYRQVGWLNSFRCTWGPPRDEGKKELYFGFKIGSDVPGLGFTFQIRR